MREYLIFSKFFLKHTSKNIYLFSIRGLYIIKNFGNKKNFFLAISNLNFSLIIRKIFFSFKKFVFFLIRNLIFSKVKITKLKKKNILIVSHIVDSKISIKNDTYFFSFVNYLKKKKISFLRILINQKSEIKDSSTINGKTVNSVIIFPSYLKFFDEIKIFFLRMFNAINLFFILLNYGHLKYFKFLFYSLFNSETTLSIKMYYYFKRILKVVKPRYFIFTYEGYPWENACLRSIKDSNLKTKCIGYQHSIITKDHLSIRNFFLGNQPDIIWFSDNLSLKLLKNELLKNNINYLKVGNFKKKKKLKFSKVKKIDFLVLPEGDYSECQKLFSFTLNLAINFEKLSFIWRVHPVINFDRVLSNLNLEYKNIPQNIHFSKSSSLELDCQKCKYVVYRTSNAVIDAINCKLIPIYLKLKKERLIMCPLGKSFKKKIITSSFELLRFIKKKGEYYKKKNINIYFKSNLDLLSKKNNYFK